MPHAAAVAAAAAVRASMAAGSGLPPRPATTTSGPASTTGPSGANRSGPAATGSSGAATSRSSGFTSPNRRPDGQLTSRGEPHGPGSAPSGSSRPPLVPPLGPLLRRDKADHGASTAHANGGLTEGPGGHMISPAAAALSGASLLRTFASGNGAQFIAKRLDTAAERARSRGDGSQSNRGPLPRRASDASSVDGDESPRQRRAAEAPASTSSSPPLRLPEGYISEMAQFMAQTHNRAHIGPLEYATLSCDVASTVAGSWGGTVWPGDEARHRRGRSNDSDVDSRSGVESDTGDETAAATTPGPSQAGNAGEASIGRRASVGSRSFAESEAAAAAARARAAVGGSRAGAAAAAAASGAQQRTTRDNAAHAVGVWLATEEGSQPTSWVSLASAGMAEIDVGNHLQIETAAIAAETHSRRQRRAAEVAEEGERRGEVLEALAEMHVAISRGDEATFTPRVPPARPPADSPAAPAAAHAAAGPPRMTRTTSIAPESDSAAKATLVALGSTGFGRGPKIIKVLNAEGGGPEPADRRSSTVSFAS